MKKIVEEDKWLKRDSIEIELARWQDAYKNTKKLEVAIRAREMIKRLKECLR